MNRAPLDPCASAIAGGAPCIHHVSGCAMPQRESPRGSTTQPKGETRIRNRLPALVVANVDPGLRLLLKRTLSAAGYEVALVATVQDLVTKVSADQPEGILLSTSFAGDQTPAL